MKPHVGKIAKVWVCGTPQMNEDFDGILQKLSTDYELKRH